MLTEKMNQSKSWSETFIDYGKFLLKSSYGIWYTLALVSGKANCKPDMCRITPYKNCTVIYNVNDLGLSRYEDPNANHTLSPIIQDHKYVYENFLCNLSVDRTKTPDDCVGGTFDIKATCDGDHMFGGILPNCTKDFADKYTAYDIALPKGNDALKLDFIVTQAVKDEECKNDNVWSCSLDMTLGFENNHPCQRKDKSQYNPPFKVDCHLSKGNRGIYNDFGVKYPQKQQAPKRNSMFHEHREFKGGHPSITNSDEYSNIPRNRRYK